VGNKLMDKDTALCPRGVSRTRTSHQRHITGSRYQLNCTLWLHLST